MQCAPEPSCIVLGELFIKFISKCERAIQRDIVIGGWFDGIPATTANYISIHRLGPAKRDDTGRRCDAVGKASLSSPRRPVVARGSVVAFS